MKNYKILKKKLVALSQKDKVFEIFGSETHHYQLLPPLAETKILEYEKQFRISIPTEYRTFLKEVGSSGAGPYYGLYPVKKHLTKKIARPFDYSSTYPGSGILIIGTQGCAYDFGIVVTGSERGKMFLFVDPGWVPVIKDSKKVLDKKGNPFQMDFNSIDQKLWKTYYKNLCGKQNADLRIGFYEWYFDWLTESMDELKKIQKLQSQKKAAVAVVQKKPTLKKSVQNNAHQAWWESLSPDWQRVFKNILKIKNHPTQKDLEAIWKLQKIECYQDGDFEELNLKNLTPLAALKDLRILNCNYTNVTNLKGIAKLTKLEKIACDGNPIKDLDPLKDLISLKELSVQNTKIANLNALKNLKSLDTLNCFMTKIKSLIALSDLINLKSLHIGETKNLNLKPLENLQKLQVLKMTSVKIKNPNIIGSLTNLHELQLVNTHIKTLEMISNLKKLKKLFIYEPKIRTLEPIWNLKLQTLNCKETKISLEDIAKFKKAHPQCKIER